MPKVKLTIAESKCRCGYFKKGQEFIVEDLCPPLCHELWNSIYPFVYAYRMELRLTMEIAVQKSLIQHVRMKEEFAFVEKWQMNRFRLREQELNHAEGGKK